MEDWEKAAREFISHNAELSVLYRSFSTDRDRRLQASVEEKLAELRAVSDDETITHDMLVASLGSLADHIANEHEIGTQERRVCLAAIRRVRERVEEYGTPEEWLGNPLNIHTVVLGIEEIERACWALSYWIGANEGRKNELIDLVAGLLKAEKERERFMEQVSSRWPLSSLKQLFDPCELLDVDAAYHVSHSDAIAAQTQKYISSPWLQTPLLTKRLLICFIDDCIDKLRHNQILHHYSRRIFWKQLLVVFAMGVIVAALWYWDWEHYCQIIWGWLCDATRPGAPHYPPLPPTVLHIIAVGVKIAGALYFVWWIFILDTTSWYRARFRIPQRDWPEVSRAETMLAQTRNEVESGQYDAREVARRLTMPIPGRILCHSLAHSLLSLREPTVTGSLSN